jgi:hypothetical protein
MLRLFTDALIRRYRLSGPDLLLKLKALVAEKAAEAIPLSRDLRIIAQMIECR